VNNLKSTSRLRPPAMSFFVVFMIVAGLPIRPVQAQTYTVLHTFTGMPDGAQPAEGLIRDTQGNLYGTTNRGGDQHCDGDFGIPGCGTVFEIDKNKDETILHNFDNENGAFPSSRLTRDAEGNLYGATLAGGTANDGTVFELAPGDQYTILYSFPGGAGGSEPTGLIRTAAGTFYGSTLVGGNSTNSGILFELNKADQESVLYTFTCPECSGLTGNGFGNPYAVIRDASGTFYGNAWGGTKNDGVVYKVDRKGVATVLHNFVYGRNGWDPSGSLIRDAAGNLYGTTTDNDGSACAAIECGNVFKIDPTTGKQTVLHRFDGGIGGGRPTGGLVRDPQGNLYGTTRVGGSGPYQTCGDIPLCGVVYKIDPNGKETVLHSFTNGPDGGFPNADLLRDAAGNLYGTTTSGGDPTCNCGVVFKITP
jgi:uncharacterized repeat protein (TIGR03803 family)